MSEGDRQPWRKLSPEVDRAQDRADAAQARFDGLAAVATAENVVGAVRREELVEAPKKAWRRVSAARGRLTKAQKDGDAERIIQARRRVDELYAEADRISRECLREMQSETRAGLDTLAAMNELVGEVFDALSAVGDAIERRSRRPRPCALPAACGHVYHCPTCGAGSCNPGDAEHGYCGACGYQ